MQSSGRSDPEERDYKNRLEGKLAQVFSIWLVAPIFREHRMKEHMATHTGS